MFPDPAAAVEDASVPELPPPPDPPFPPAFPTPLQFEAPAPPPADVIVLKVETLPVTPCPLGDGPPAPPPPTAIGKPVAVTDKPSGATNGDDV